MIRSNHAPADYAWKSVDPLGEALHALRLSGTFYCRSELTAPWGIYLPPMPEYLMFHVVTSGDFRIVLDNGSEHHARAGDFALIPHGLGHELKSHPGQATKNIFDIPRKLISPRYELLNYGGGGEKTLMICGAVRAKDPSAWQFIKILPEILIFRTDSRENEWLLHSINLMAEEARALRPGGDTIITRVSDILVVQAIRSWLGSDPLARTGWLGALRDEYIGKAIALIHRHPLKPWSVESLADEVGISRSSFSARFMKLAGQPPMQYVRQWRFRLAENWLRETDLSMADMAEKLGYNSEAAFSRAFKTFTGKTPGKVRKESC